MGLVEGCRFESCPRCYRSGIFERVMILARSVNDPGGVAATTSPGSFHVRLPKEVKA